MEEPGPSAATPPTDEREARPGLGARLGEGRKTFQPGLWLRLLLIGFGIVYLILFVVLNARTVRVSFVFTSTHVSLIWVIVLAGLIGIALGVLLSQVHRHRSRRAQRAKR